MQAFRLLRSRELFGRELKLQGAFISKQQTTPWGGEQGVSGPKVHPKVLPTHE